MNPYWIDISQSNLEGPFVSLGVLYEGMPATSGCEKCKEVNGEECNWCCLCQSPSMYYVEFLKVFKEVGDNWSDEQKTEILLRSVRNYLDNSINKGCVFYDNECTVYNVRPFNCRLYGVIPEGSWNKRWEALQERQGDKFNARPQCSLVSSEREVTPTLEDKWFLHTRECEERIGMPIGTINLHDEAGGSYRTFHDHLLLELLGEDVLATLSNVRLTNPSKEDIELTIEEMRKSL